MERDDDLEDLHGEKRFTEIVDLAEDLSLGAGLEGFMGFLPHTQRTAWRNEIPRYEKAAKAHPTIGLAWFNLGYAQLMADRPEAAVTSLGKALDLGYRKPTTLYNLACAEARSGNTEQAFEWLFAAIDAGYRRGGPHGERLGPRRASARTRASSRRSRRPALARRERPGTKRTERAGAPAAQRAARLASIAW